MGRECKRKQYFICLSFFHLLQGNVIANDLEFPLPTSAEVSEYQPQCQQLCRNVLCYMLLELQLQGYQSKWFNCL